MDKINKIIEIYKLVKLESDYPFNSQFFYDRLMHYIWQIDLDKLNDESDEKTIFFKPEPTIFQHISELNNIKIPAIVNQHYYIPRFIMYYKF
jgi:hypothetical protein